MVLVASTHRNIHTNDITKIGPEQAPSVPKRGRYQCDIGNLYFKHKMCMNHIPIPVVSFAL